MLSDQGGKCSILEAGVVEIHIKALLVTTIIFSATLHKILKIIKLVVLYCFGSICTAN